MEYNNSNPGGDQGQNLLQNTDPYGLPKAVDPNMPQGMPVNQTDMYGQPQMGQPPAMGAPGQPYMQPAPG